MAEVAAPNDLEALGLDEHSISILNKLNPLLEKYGIPDTKLAPSNINQLWEADTHGWSNIEEFIMTVFLPDIAVDILIEALSMEKVKEALEEFLHCAFFDDVAVIYKFLEFFDYHKEEIEHTGIDYWLRVLLREMYIPRVGTLWAEEHPITKWDTYTFHTRELVETRHFWKVALDPTKTQRRIRNIFQVKQRELRRRFSQNLVFFYHGTDCRSVDSILQEIKFGTVDRSRGWDFHRAFYTSKDPVTAFTWAKQRTHVQNMPKKRPVVLSAVIGFACSREAWRETKVLKLDTESHWEYVVDGCRNGNSDVLDSIYYYNFDAIVGRISGDESGSRRQVAFRDTLYSRSLLHGMHKFVLFIAHYGVNEESDEDESEESDSDVS